MGLNYAYEFLNTMPRLPLLFASLREIVVDEDRARWDRLADGNHVEVSFCFPSDGALQRYASELSSSAHTDIKVGGVQVALACGARFASLHLTAVTMGMSYLFEESPSVRMQMGRLGQKADAVVVMLDRETEERIALWPKERTFFVPESDDEEVHPDRQCDAIQAAIVASERRPVWPSWEHRWLERDRAFFEAMGKESRESRCRHASCDRGSVAMSVFCRQHHFEQIHQRSCPFVD